MLSVSIVNCFTVVFFISILPPAASKTKSAAAVTTISPLLEDVSETPPCPSIATTEEFESIVIPPEDVAIDTAPSPALISSAAKELAAGNPAPAPPMCRTTAPPEVASPIKSLPAAPPVPSSSQASSPFGSPVGSVVDEDLLI